MSHGLTGRAGRQVKLAAWRRDAMRRVQASRQRSRSVDAAFVVQMRDRAVGGNLLASAIAYRVFLWLLPVALLVAAGLGFAQSTDGREPERLGADLELGKSVIAVVASAAQQAERSRYIVLFLALFGIYVAGAAGAKTVIAVHRFAWGMSPLGSRVGPLASAAFTGAAVAMMGLSLGAQVLRSHTPGLGMVAAAVIAAFYAAVWLGVSVLLPHGTASWVRLLPGALLFGIGTQVVHLVSVYYLSERIQTASELYGGLGFAATLLFGLYLVARLVVAAAVLNATLAAGGPGETPTPPITRRG